MGLHGEQDDGASRDEFRPRGERWACQGFKLDEIDRMSDLDILVSRC